MPQGLVLTTLRAAKDCAVFLLGDARMHVSGWGKINMKEYGGEGIPSAPNARHMFSVGTRRVKHTIDVWLTLQVYVLRYSVQTAHQYLCISVVGKTYPTPLERY